MKYRKYTLCLAQLVHVLWWNCKHAIFDLFPQKSRIVPNQMSAVAIQHHDVILWCGYANILLRRSRTAIRLKHQREGPPKGFLSINVEWPPRSLAFTLSKFLCGATSRIKFFFKSSLKCGGRSSTNSNIAAAAWKWLGRVFCDMCERKSWYLFWKLDHSVNCNIYFWIRIYMYSMARSPYGK